MYYYLFDMRDTAYKLIKSNPDIDFSLYAGESHHFVFADLRNDVGLYDELCDYAWFNGMTNEEAKARVLDNLDLLIEACAPMLKQKAKIRRHVENGDWIWFDLLIRRHVADEAIEMAMDDLEFEGLATWERDEDDERSEDNE